MPASDTPVACVTPTPSPAGVTTTTARATRRPASSPLLARARRIRAVCASTAPSPVGAGTAAVMSSRRADGSAPSRPARGTRAVCAQTAPSTCWGTDVYNQVTDRAPGPAHRYRCGEGSYLCAALQQRSGLLGQQPTQGVRAGCATGWAVRRCQRRLWALLRDSRQWHHHLLGRQLQSAIECAEGALHRGQRKRFSFVRPARQRHDHLLARERGSRIGRARWTVHRRHHRLGTLVRVTHRRHDHLLGRQRRLRARPERRAERTIHGHRRRLMALLRPAYQRHDRLLGARTHPAKVTRRMDSSPPSPPATGTPAACRTNGTITCWGSNADDEHGQSDAPSGQFAAITAGWVHSLRAAYRRHDHLLGLEPCRANRCAERTIPPP